MGYLVARQPDVVGLSDRATVAVLPFENLSTAADGEVLALGIAESVLHQLANLQQLDVISRTSSFNFRGRSEDAREIGRLLKANYLLEGSVQSDRARLRITTQLIDARTGADVWSMRFDRRPSDIFAVQDEIAVQVTRALELTLDENAMARMKGQGTENLDAYLAYLQARTLLAGDRVADVQQAIEQLQRAAELDPNFAAAYVGLAEAGLFAAEYDVTEDRQSRFEAALAEGLVLVERALSVDPDNGEAYLARASMKAFTDLVAAEADFRRGLELSPNSARGYHGLAVVLYETPARRDEALAMLDRARKLDPLQPAYDVTKAVFLLYERGDVQSAENLLLDVLRRNPDYQPALARLSEIRIYVLGQSADGIESAERALELDPLAEDLRRGLVRAYLDVDDVHAAEQVADAAPTNCPCAACRSCCISATGCAQVRRPTIQWRARRFRRRTAPGGCSHPYACADLGQLGARTGGARTLSGVQWDAAGRPMLPARPGLREAASG